MSLVHAVGCRDRRKYYPVTYLPESRAQQCDNVNYLHEHVRACVQTCEYVGVYACTYTRLSMCVCMYGLMDIWMYGCMHVCKLGAYERGCLDLNTIQHIQPSVTSALVVLIIFFLIISQHCDGAYS